MNAQINHSCSAHDSPCECPDVLVAYSAVFDEYSLVIHDGGTSSIGIGFCPWCGTDLPASRRERWFDELAALGFDDPMTQQIPERFSSDAWYRSAATGPGGSGESSEP